MNFKIESIVQLSKNVVLQSASAVAILDSSRALADRSQEENRQSSGSHDDDQEHLRSCCSPSQHESSRVVIP